MERHTDCIRFRGKSINLQCLEKDQRAGTSMELRDTENVLIEVAQTQILTHLPTTQSDQCRISLSIDLGSGHFAAWVVFLGHGNGEKGNERDAGTMRDKATAWINLSLVNVRDKNDNGSCSWQLGLAGNWQRCQTRNALASCHMRCLPYVAYLQLWWEFAYAADTRIPIIWCANYET